MSNLKEETPTPDAKQPGVVDPETGAVTDANSAGAYLRASFVRIKGGETGVLPVVAGLLLVSVLFQVANSHFLTAGNLVNLLVQAAVFSLLAMGEVFALLLGEIDLSSGFVAGLSAVVMAVLVGPTHGWPWWAAILAALVVCALIGILQGSLITRIGLPSFVVTLAGLLFWEGVMLYILGDGGSILIQDNIINDIGSGTLTRVGGWVVMLVVVALYATQTWRRDQRRRDAGLMAPPPSLSLAKIISVLAAGVLLVLLCNADRGILVPVYGMPWVILLVFAVVAVWTFVLGRLKFGRYIYAIGGNAEAARRAGINLKLIRTAAFMLCSFTAGIAGIVYALDLHRAGRRHPRPVLSRCSGHRRHKPLRWSRESHARRDRRHRHRRHRQRHGPARLQCRSEVHRHSPGASDCRHHRRHRPAQPPRGNLTRSGGSRGPFASAR